MVFATVISATLLAACGGNSEPAGAPQARISNRSVPHYDGTTELLVLPQLQVGANLQTDVQIRLAADGSWELVSSGPIRASNATDAPSATLGAPGSRASLDGAQTDATLTVRRLHVGTRVFGTVAVKLTGQRWAFAADPQEVKALKMEDFKSNAALHADESHHVVLKSAPDSGVQDVPMALAARSYRFCMEAQAVGADSTALIDAAGTTLFTLQAGEPCVTVQAKAGSYTLRHRYGGTGASRTVFLRHQSNTDAAVPAARAMPAALRSAALASASPQALQQALPQAAPVSNFAGVEYWAVRRAALDPSDPGFFVFLGVDRPTYNAPMGHFWCNSELKFGFTDQWMANTFMRVKKDALNVPIELGQALVCTPVPFFPMLQNSYLSLSSDGSMVTYPDQLSMFIGGPVWQGAANQGLLRANDSYVITALTITNQAANQFALKALNAQLPVYTMDNGTVAMPRYGNDGSGGYRVLDRSPHTAIPMAVAFRFLPGGLQQPFKLGVGQAALFTGPNCTGAAVITEDISMPSLALANGINATGLGTSFQLGLQTSATMYTDHFYLGTAKQYDQLTCTTPGGPAPGSMRVEVDTVTMVLSTDSCEYCNLTGADLSGLNLANVKLRNANLSGLVLSGLNLSGADLRYATLQGAIMNNVNLEGANLCSAQLNGSAAVPAAAVLTGAHLKNTNLALANLDGVKFSGASFFGTQQGSCQQTSCSTYTASSCASAYGASVNNAKFDSAYLANVDMGNVAGVAIDFSGATLLGVSLAGANLALNANTSLRTSFSKASLQGTDFSRANVAFADFTGAAMDLGSSCAQAILAPTYAQFPGYKSPAAAGSTSCVAGQPAAPFCVQAIFAASPQYPVTSCSNLCADGSTPGVVDPRNGACLGGAASCSPQSWSLASAAAGGAAIKTASCQSAAPLCGNLFASTANTCW